MKTSSATLPVSDPCPVSLLQILPDPPAKLPADEHLREALKRCSPATIEAACRFHRDGNPDHLPTLIAGIIERFVEPGLRGRLRAAKDELILAEDLGIDSLTFMEIVLLTEEVLPVAITTDELRPLRTLGDVNRFIAEKLAGRPERQAQAG
jgi:3-hydroxyacyl-[acyl-carrier-protein] dehydratase